MVLTSIPLGKVDREHTFSKMHLVEIRLRGWTGQAFYPLTVGQKMDILRNMAVLQRITGDIITEWLQPRTLKWY